jgi:hypothetical protein
MAADPTYGPKIRMTNNGDTLDIAPGGSLTYDGGSLSLTAPAATSATNSSPYGYAQAQADAVITWIRAVDARLKLINFAA